LRRSLECTGNGPGGFEPAWLRSRSKRSHHCHDAIPGAMGYADANTQTIDDFLPRAVSIIRMSDNA